MSDIEPETPAPPGAEPARSTRRARRRWPRTTRGRVILASVLVLALAGGGTAAWALWPRAATTPQAVRQVVTLSPTTLKETVSATGTLAAARRADLSFSSSAAVTDVSVEVGDTVKKGQELAAIDDESLQIALRSAKADLTAAKESLADLEDDDASDTAIRAAEASVQVKKNAVEQAELNLASATLTAPFDGVVAEVNVAEGDTVGSQGGSQPGAQGDQSTSDADIVVITNDTFTVDTTVSAADVASIKRGLQAELSVSGSDEAVYGTVASVAVEATTSNSGSSAFPVTIDVTGHPKGLFAGSSVTVEIVTAQHTDVLAVPSAAVATVGDSSTVTTVVDGVDTETPVTIGQTIDGSVIVTEGLAEGDQVVIETFTPTMGQGARTGRSDDSQVDGGFPGGGFPGGGEGGFPGGGGNMQPPAGFQGGNR
ncbi:MAG: efflux RND transporter periplasmic adaptor subunit [Arachnia sp.]